MQLPVDGEVFAVKIFLRLSKNAKIYLAKFIQRQNIITANNYDTIGNTCSNYDELCSAVVMALQGTFNRKTGFQTRKV